MTSPTASLPCYTEDDFRAPPEGPCDLILEGGIASGVVHPYVVLELARKHRLNAIGATSAGANAGVLAAAAEYARTVRGDPGGFLRMKKICDARAGALGDLFQEEPGFEPVMALFKGRGGLLPRALTAFRTPLLLGALSGLILTGVLAFAGGTAPPPGDFGPNDPVPVLMGLARLAVVLGGALLGALLALALSAARIGRRLNARLGICTGLSTRPDRAPAITDWLHRSIQDIAFGPGGPSPGKVLTFGDLEADPDKRLQLRLIVSNLSQQRPHTLPDTWPAGRYRPSEWARIFPADILRHLQACTVNVGDGARSLPAWRDLPILVASRMSMSVPGLFEPVPVELLDVETPRRIAEMTGGAAPPPRFQRVLFSDGGFTSNFPIHLFDAPLPDWPTYAVDFEELPPGAAGAGRVVIVTGAEDTRINPVEGLGDYVGSLLATSRNWNDLLLSLLPIHRDRIARVHLAPDQGGLNLTMTVGEVVTLMGYGVVAGQKLAATSFPAHQARRVQALYASLAEVSRDAHRVWKGKGLDAAFRSGALPAPALTARDRDRIAVALDGLAGIALLKPLVKAAFKSPAGQPRITPRY